MSWKISPEDLLLNHRLEARGQFGSRLSLGRFSIAPVIKNYGKMFLIKIQTYFILQSAGGSIESMGCAEAKKQIFVKTAMYKVSTVDARFNEKISV